ncbi:hypothetical protein ABPG74_018094 [Tetrahymena malaccensis]
MEQQIQENSDSSLSKELDSIQLEADVKQDTSADDLQRLGSDTLQKQQEEIKLQEELKENDDEEGKNSKDIKKELTLEEQQKKIDRLHQCILAIVALKKMNTDHMPAKIVDFLYLGSIGAALKKDVIEKLNIKFILSAMDKSKPMFQDICTYKQIPILDSPDVDIQKYFDESSEFINQAIQSQQNILVHCFAGKSRSTTLVLAYLMKHQNLALDEALSLVRQTREIAQPNTGFMKQLQIYEQSLKIQKQNEENKI